MAIAVEYALVGENPVGGDQIVDDVMRCGYRWKGVVLRPAMVRVKG
jgi:molecular chaperone GrpE (heat shock protein)